MRRGGPPFSSVHLIALDCLGIFEIVRTRAVSPVLEDVNIVDMYLGIDRIGETCLTMIVGFAILYATNSMKHHISEYVLFIVSSIKNMNGVSRLTCSETSAEVSPASVLFEVN